MPLYKGFGAWEGCFRSLPYLSRHPSCNQQGVKAITLTMGKGYGRDEGSDEGSDGFSKMPLNKGAPMP